MLWCISFCEKKLNCHIVSQVTSNLTVRKIRCVTKVEAYKQSSWHRKEKLRLFYNMIGVVSFCIRKVK